METAVIAVYLFDLAWKQLSLQCIYLI